MSIFTDQSVIENTPLPVDGSGVTQPVSGTVTANVGTTNGLALDATLTGGTQKTKLVDSGGTNVATVTATGAVKIDGSAVTQPVSGTVSISGTVATTVGGSATATITQVVLTNNTNATLLASNASRKKAILFVPSSTLQIKFGAVASTTSFTYKVTSNNTTIEITGYTGQIDAFGSGQTVTITEL